MAITVELVNDSAWWLPWLPVVGSAVVAAVAFIGVIVSNRTNRAAITASDERAQQDRHDARTRDFRTWQRDTLLEIAAPVVQAALEGQEEYFRIAYSARANALDPATFDEVARLGGIVGAATAKLMIVGAHDLADECRAVRKAMNSRECVDAVIKMNQHISNTATGGTGDDVDKNVELRAELDACLEEINQARGYFGQAAETALRRTTDLTPE